MFSKDTIRIIVAMLAVSGEDAVRRAITISEKESIKMALKNKDEPQEMIDKRDAWVDATIDYVKEIANLDFD